MSVVVFSYANWAARYPELAGSIAAPQAQMFFNEATLYCDNTDSSPVCDVAERTTLLNMLTAHIAKLGGFINGQYPRDAVGRIASAGEGSVNGSFDYAVKAGSEKWYAQTQYGASYWAATTKYRILTIEAECPYNPDPYAGFLFGGGWR